VYFESFPSAGSSGWRSQDEDAAPPEEPIEVMKILTWTLVSLAFVGHVTTRSTLAAPSSSEGGENSPSPSGGLLVGPPLAVLEDVYADIRRAEATQSLSDAGPEEGVRRLVHVRSLPAYLSLDAAVLRGVLVAHSGCAFRF
jgi:hypothetical protein